MHVHIASNKWSTLHVLLHQNGQIQKLIRGGGGGGGSWEFFKISVANN